MPDPSAQTITLTLPGASASDFEVQVGNTFEQLNSNRTFAVTLAAGATGVSFGLIDVMQNHSTSDIAGGAVQIATSMISPWLDLLAVARLFLANRGRPRRVTTVLIVRSAGRRRVLNRRSVGSQWGMPRGAPKHVGGTAFHPLGHTPKATP